MPYQGIKEDTKEQRTDCNRVIERILLKIQLADEVKQRADAHKKGEVNYEKD